MWRRGQEDSTIQILWKYWVKFEKDNAGAESGNCDSGKIFRNTRINGF